VKSLEVPPLQTSLGRYPWQELCMALTTQPYLSRKVLK
jgi:hypothetical protein